MRVVVDRERCEGHARCWGICPEVFALDDEGHAVVTLPDIPPDLQARATDAVRNCPERAIRID
jgi:ferredoxin